MSKDTALTIGMNHKLTSDPDLLVRLVEAQILTVDEARAALRLPPKGLV